VAVACVLRASSGDAALHAAQDGANEHDVKATMVLNFLKFVAWPAEADEPLVVLVVGNDPIVEALRRSASEPRSAGRQVLVKSASASDVPADANAVFITRAARSALPGIVRAVEGRGILTLGDTEGFGQQGVVLNMYVSDHRVRFEVNTAAAARAGVELRSQLLRLARIVG
jgi:hypothetical protein